MVAYAVTPLPSDDADDLFSSLEWLVIASGIPDHSVPLQWSPLGRSLLRLLGGDAARLSMPCLETLRETAHMAARHGWALPAAHVGAFHRGGWSEDQLACLIDAVQPGEPFIDAWSTCDIGHGEMPPQGRFQGHTFLEMFT